MGDDDKTQRLGRPGSHWGDDRRAREGQRHRSTAPRGVPIAPIEREHTPVWDGREAMAPMTRGDGEQLVAYIKSRLDDTGADEVAALRAELADLRREVAPLSALRKWLWASAITVLISVGAFLYTRGASEGETRQRMEQMDRFIDELRRDVRALEQQRHASLSPAVSPDAISSANEGYRP